MSKNKAQQDSPQKPSVANATRSKLRAALSGGFMLVSALAMALFIKFFLVDLYVIPSGSMEPMLFGKDSMGDRVLCTKQSYRFRDPAGPRRWEIFVFKFPAEAGKEHYGDNFIKRCVGLPGEVIAISDGDLYLGAPGDAGASILSKPIDLQDQLWQAAYRDDFTATSNEAALDQFWTRHGERGSWRLENGCLHAKSSTPVKISFLPQANGVRLDGIPDRHVKRQVVTYSCPQCKGKLSKTVMDQHLSAFCPTCGAYLRETNIIDFPNTGLPDDPKFLQEQSQGRGSTRSYPLNNVSDLRLSCLAKATSENTCFALELVSGSDSWTAWIQAADNGWSVWLERNGHRVGETVDLVDKSKGSGHANGSKIEFFRSDGRFFLRVDGEEAISCKIPGMIPEAKRQASYSGASLMLARGEVEFRELAIDRDIHYFFVPDRMRQGQEWALCQQKLKGGNMSQRYLLERLDFMDDHHCYIVPPNNYLGFGDNCPTSNDSRMWGPVPEENLIGPAPLVWWPPHRIKLLR